ncbi:glycosyltransferase family 4 protein [Pseudobutyrivibrio ruminis]|uniref:glycosyltransferase family 4 protein n=1 Tax=Pseudobutyrivibrio ruminis TaxID=46206 RepID=UPI00042229D8|nr:glycosyltransferase family 4 protein [Pseudobutyrivibrio ruminis]
MKLVIFGIGNFYKKKIKELYDICPSAEIVAFIDNKAYGMKMDEIDILNPLCIKELTFDYILLMSISENAMEKQLVEMGICLNKILTWQKFLKLNGYGKAQIVGKKDLKKTKQVGIITCPMGYNGGSIAAMSLALALKKIGYGVSIITEEIDNKLVEEISLSIEVIIYPNISILGSEEIEFLKDYNYIWINTAQMANYAYKIGAIKPTIWWIHEGEKDFIEKGYRQIDWRVNKDKLKVKVFAVSNIAKEEYNKVYNKQSVSILPVGIPNTMKEGNFSKNKKIVFAVIGSIVKIKAQDVFLNAADLINNNGYDVEYWLIGKKFTDNEYNCVVEKLINNVRGVRLLGELSRSELNLMYKDIDVLVCPSFVESLSLTTIEAMMNNIPVIVSDATGISEYIKSGKEGFVFKNGDTKDLAEKMQWLIDNPSERGEMGTRARKLYENQFSLDVFANNVAHIMEGM